MKVNELIDILKELPPETEVILQKDPEGNGYDTLYAVDPNCIFLEDEGEIYSTDWTADECCMEECEWEELKSKNEKCVVLAP